MNKAKVYFTNLRTTPNSNLLDKMERLVRKAGIADISFEQQFTAIKIHFGEPGNLAYIRPNYAARLVQVLRSLGAKPFLTDCNTLYAGRRANAVDPVSYTHLDVYKRQALFGLVGAQVSFANALLYTSPVNITIIAAMTPLAVMLIAALILKEPVTFKKAAGVLIGASGALLIIFQSSAINTDSSGNWIGNLLCIVNVITYAIYLVITRPISQRYSYLLYTSRCV